MFRRSGSAIFFLLLLAVANVDPVNAESVIINDVPEDYTMYPEHGAAYKFHEESLSWSEAKQTCINEGGYLAVIDTYSKVDLVMGLKPIGWAVWVGFYRDTFLMSSWLSAKDGTPVSNLPWLPIQLLPFSRCAAVAHLFRGLKCKPCFFRTKFICEIELQIVDSYVETFDDFS